MNPLKNLFNKVFESTPPSDAGTPKEDSSFEWNPDEETVAATSSRATSWKRGDTADESPSWANNSRRGRSTPIPVRWRNTEQSRFVEPLEYC